MSASAEATLRVDNKVFAVGNSALLVMARKGPPTLRELYNPQAGGLPDNQVASGELLQCEKDGMTIIITIFGGRAKTIQTWDD